MQLDVYNDFTGKNVVWRTVISLASGNELVTITNQQICNSVQVSVHSHLHIGFKIRTEI